MQDQNKTVLITEDEAAMSDLLKDKLTTAGFTILQAANGEEGLRIALEHHPDLILLDLLMPKLDGMSMMNKLRQNSWGKTVPIIVLTNVSPDTNESLQEIIKTQPAYYFIKSDSKLEDIAEKVKEVLSPK